MPGKKIIQQKQEATIWWDYDDACSVQTCWAGYFLLLARLSNR